MFRRKRSVSRHQPLSASSAQSAHSAATHAFLNAQPATSSLSAAAAAAALRSRTPTPTAVENVQTKRMMQRRGSVSSQASGTASLRPGSQNGLQRMNSSGSMSTRTFREQSPRRTTTSTGAADAPPLPAIPPNLVARQGSHRRSFSLEPIPRTSAGPARPSGRGVSVDRYAPASPTQPSARARPVDQTSPGRERASSRNSINFSYPTGARPNSPPQSPTQSNHVERSPRSAATNRLPVAEVSTIQNSVNQAASKPVKSTPKSLAPGSVEGSHLATGSTTARLSGTAVAIAAKSISAGAQPSAPAAAVVAAEQHATTPAQAQTVNTPVHDVERADEEPPEPQIQTSRPPMPTKLPSTVQEDYEGEERAEAISAAETVDDNQSSKSHPAHDEQARIDQTGEVLPVSSAPESPRREQTSAQPEAVSAHIRQSSSPGRSARFSQQLSITGEVLHEPPLRSVSPAKSALKHSAKNSLSPERRPMVASHPGHAPSEVSDVTSIASDEGSRHGPRKKHAKVSFDDEAEVVGFAASPPTSPEDYTPSAPQVKPKPKSHWFGLGKKKDPQNESPGEEFDELYKPRPVLPSFGSIRGTRETEQPKLAPNNLSDDSSSNSDDQALQPAIRNASARSVPQSSTHVEHVENIHAASPAAVAQTDGSNSSVDPQPFHTQDHAALSRDHEDREEVRVTSDDRVDESPEVPVAIPTIAVQPASPENERDRSSLEMYHLPGDFPSTTAGGSEGSAEVSQGAAPAGPAADVPSDHAAAAGVAGAEDDSDGSVYSDAPEDWNGGDGEEFGSINAIVDGEIGPVGVALGTPSDYPEYGADFVVPKVDNRPQVTEAASGHETMKQNGKLAEPMPLPVPMGSVSQAVSARSTTDTTGAKEQTTSEAGNVRTRSSKTTATPETATGYSDGPSQSKDSVRQRPVSMSAKMSTAGAVVSQAARPIQTSPPRTTMRRTMSNDSDSSSSFRRSKLSSKSDGPFSMRRTMRGAESSGAQSSSNRSPPPDERRPFASGSTSGPMRSTLRDGRVSSKTSRMSATSRKVPKAGGAGKTTGFSFTSRFDDSDDERGAGASQSRAFLSRFADSSDEDETPVTRFRPVRGIPRRRGADDGDSTELEDSSEDERRPPGVRAPARAAASVPTASSSGLDAVAKARGMTTAELEAFLNQPRGRKKSGIFGGLFSRSSKAPAPPKDGKHKIQKSNLESPSRRDTHLERTRLERDHLRRNPSSSSGHANALKDRTAATTTTESVEPSSSKLSPRRLLRKNTGNANPDPWPLGPPPASQPEPARPQTSDGVVPVPVPAANGRATAVNGKLSKETAAGATNGRANGTSTPEVPGIERSASDVVIAGTGTGRKKRFSMLRKAFGMKS